MQFFTSAIDTLQTLVVALGAGLGVWGVVNLLEGYGSDNPSSKSQGICEIPLLLNVMLKLDKLDRLAVFIECNIIKFLDANLIIGIPNLGTS